MKNNDINDKKVFVELGVAGTSSSKPIFQVRGDAFDDDSSLSSIDDEPMPSTSRGLRDNEEPYIVVEVDSDVEFIDEVIFHTSQVEIEEVGSFKYQIDDQTTDLPDIVEEYDDDAEIEEIEPIEESEGEGYYEEEEYDDGIFKGYTTTTTTTITSSSTTIRRKIKDPHGVQLVDLVSSDEDENGEEVEMKNEIIQENIAVKNFADTIWSKFVPNSVVHLEFPPASLLPKEIQRNIGTKTSSSSSATTATTTEKMQKEQEIPITYEFDMKDQRGDQSDLELEKIVDELKIGEPMDAVSSGSTTTTTSTTTNAESSTNNNNVTDNDNTSKNSTPIKNWKEWRQQFVMEAHDVFNSSLLGGGATEGKSKRGGIGSGGGMEKLNLWTNNNNNHADNSNNGIRSKSNNNNTTKENDQDQDNTESDFTFYLYNATDKRIHKAKLGLDVKPAYRIFISRNIELVRNLRTLKGKRKDEDVPILIALVQEDQGVTFLLPDLTPIHNLF